MPKSGELCKLGGYSDRTMRYVIERRLVPGLSAAGTGNHRDYTGEMAFLLAVACELRELGLSGESILSLTKKLQAEKVWQNTRTATYGYEIANSDGVTITLYPATVCRKVGIIP